MDDAMKKVIAIRTGRHCVFNLHMHLVFVTKYRQKVFSKEHLDFMQIIFNDVCVINKQSAPDAHNGTYLLNILIIERTSNPL